MLILLFFAGLACLVLGANVLVRGASKLALSLGLSPLIVGLTVVAFGTSAPEMAVSVGAALKGATDIAVGNVVGSNVFNILFILGISALIAPLVVDEQLIRQEVPIMIGASVLLWLLALDHQIERLEGGVLFALLLGYTTFLVVQARRKAAREATSSPPRGDGPAPAEASPAEASSWDRPTWVQILLVLAGLGLLVLGSRWLVQSSVAFAQALGVSDEIIGLTIVAAGTSLPEVAASITAALRGERDIAVGNVVGSNVFNILGCLGLSAMVSGEGLPVSSSLLGFDVWIMIAAAFACFPVFLSGREVARWEGGLFLLQYVAYTTYLVLLSTDHDALPDFSWTMVAFVLPLTAVTIVVTAIRAPRAVASPQV